MSYWKTETNFAISGEIINLLKTGLMHKLLKNMQMKRTQKHSLNINLSSLQIIYNSFAQVIYNLPQIVF